MSELLLAPAVPLPRERLDRPLQQRQAIRRGASRELGSPAFPRPGIDPPRWTVLDAVGTPRRVEVRSDPRSSGDSITEVLECDAAVEGFWKHRPGAIEIGERNQVDEREVRTDEEGRSR